MTTTAIDYCAGFCKGSAHYIIYPYSYNKGDVYNDVYYVRADSFSGDTDFFLISRTGNNNRYYSQVISENDFIAPSPSEFYYSDTGSDYVGLPVGRYVHTFGPDLYGCFLVSCVLSAIIGGVIRKCLK